MVGTASLRPVSRAAARTRRLLACLLLALAASVSAGAHSALADWARVSSVPSVSLPYRACKAATGRLACQLIADPAIKSDARGPVAAGALTQGPAEEVSPALSGSGVGGGYSPADLRSAYGLPAEGGKGQTVAIVDAFDDPDAEADLTVYRTEYGLGECTTADGCFRKVSQTGGTNYPAASESWAKEISLDIDMVSAICQECHLLLVEAKSNTRENLAAAEEEAVALGATEISNSFAGEGLTSTYAGAYDHSGVPTTAAGGDEGYEARFPADTPWLIAVGGTTLNRAEDSRGWEETAWSKSGSGCSQEPKPAWQQDGGCEFRTTNDIAAVANPNTPVSTYNSYPSGGWRLIGGTSAGAPIIAGAMALANRHTKSLPGADALYLESQQREEAFNDVVSGSDGSCEGSYLCTAGPGYDGPTGLGTLRGVPLANPTAIAETGSASAIELHSATLSGTVDPEGEELKTCKFEYGRTAVGEGSIPCSSLPHGSEPVAVSASLSGLKQATTYYFRLVVVGATHTSQGEERSFSTVGAAPSVSGETARAITDLSATLEAAVDPNGETVTSCLFEYGPSSALGSSTPCEPSPGAGTTAVTVSAQLTGLQGGEAYDYRVKATNGGGTTTGATEELRTLSGPPTVVTGPVSGLTGASVTLTGTVTPHGEAAELCQFTFAGVETGISGGGEPASCEQAIKTNGSPTAVSAKVTSLFEGITYQYYLEVVGPHAHGTGATLEFTVPPVPTGPRPAIKKLAPKKGIAAGGATVKITGSHFSGATAVWFGHTRAASFTVTSETTITAVDPAGASGVAQVRVTTATGGTSYQGSKSRFTYEGPTITHLEPASGPVAGGTVITLTGTGFQPVSSFIFGKAGSREGSCGSSTTCTVVSPPAAKGKAGAIEITPEVNGVKGKPGSASRFTYTG